MQFSPKILVLALLLLAPLCVYVTVDVPNFAASAYGSISAYAPAPAATDAVEPLPVTDKVLITGDILYARDVERNAKKYGADYPFAIFHDLPLYQAVVANFESSIPSVHVETPSMSTRFSSKQEIAPILFEHGITHVSLANNHALDYGTAAYHNTVSVFEDNYITAFAHPSTLATSSVAFVETASTTIAFIGVHTLFADPQPEQYQHYIQYANDNAEYVVAYVHWGEEYVTTHNATQQTLARNLIDAGADAVVGHHPHVVQDIERYRGKPIFYSLGNFVFDQYFSKDVQEGLLLELSFTEKTAEFNLLPITSLGSRNRPRLMPEVEQGLFLTSLAERSPSYLRTEITTGLVEGVR